jgi:antitoxin (DNA-binding transcriptional repressor) of toxin-antitoxin stability system
VPEKPPDQPEVNGSYPMPTNTRAAASPPKAISTFEFEARCPDIIEEVRRSRRPLLITRGGRPIAQLSPFPRGRKVRGKKAPRARCPEHEWTWFSDSPDTLPHKTT